jgi:accessory gene regulator protein AgrB
MFFFTIVLTVLGLGMYSLVRLWPSTCKARGLIPITAKKKKKKKLSIFWLLLVSHFHVNFRISLPISTKKEQLEF